MKEIIDIFDENMNHIGSMEKREAHNKNQWHKNNHIWVTDGKNVLIQLRSPKIFNFPNKWDISVAGHFQAGETPLEGAKREWEEELGIAWELGNIKEGSIFKYDKAADGSPIYEFVYIYFVNKKLDLTQLKLQKKEVAQIKYVPYKEFLRIIERGSFVPHSKDYFEIVKQGLLKLMVN